MKKIYTILFLFLIVGIAGVFLLTKTQDKKIQLGETFTPQEYWDYQFAKKREKRKNGYNKADKPDEFTKYFKAITTKFGQEDNQYAQNYRIAELNKAKSKLNKMGNQSKFSVEWTQRGPGNVGGRTRGLIVDPDDATHNTWFAGAATGGIWKTTDGGLNWTCLTDDLVNLSANTLAMAGSDHNIIYAGTGESFPGGTYMKGSGVFKSINKGADWTQLASTANNADFSYVNRLIVDPVNANIVIAATESGILKSTDGGGSWTKVYSSNTGVEDLRMDPTNFNRLYAAENSVGVVKSINAGDTWEVSSTGIASGNRFEIAVSPVNPAKIYASANVSSTVSHVYRSVDYGVNWTRFEDKNASNQNYLGGQGTYDNTIAAHPYDEDVAFLGGVNLWKVDFSDPGTIVPSTPSVLRVDLVNTQSFLSFINFGGTYLGGGMETGDKNNATNIVSTDWASVEVRFGPGLKQMAHRFTVGGVGSGVPVANYIYAGYVEVPFQVWDVTNNRQLMASFRDQEEDGTFNLIARDPADDTKGREYLFVNAVLYDPANPSADIAKNGGHAYKQLYFFWPTLAAGGTFDPNALPASKISIQYGAINLEKGTTLNVSDAYGSISGRNTYNQGAGMGGTAIPGLHPDHHAMEIVPINQSKDSFLIVNGNDGGLAISKNSGVTFNQLPNNYITTQFYGVAKKPGANEFIGGMQDNGTWRSQAGQNATSASHYLFQIGGDGFECVWSSADGNKIIGSVYYNSFYRTTNGGVSWSSASSGITSEDGPFISRLSTHRNTPDNLYALGASGIYKSTNFGSSWTNKPIATGWLGASGTAVTSQHHVEVSIANENILWAGAAMAESAGWRIFVSTNQGETFTAVPDFTGADMSGYISGIATHPFEDSTAYILFSYAKEPKVLRTKNLGQTWEDITGFVGNTSSSNGFPDVVTHSLVVLPNDPSTIWVGTDIGLFESNDDGATWHYADNGIPAVSVYDMFVQDDKVVVATHGRGIWTASITELKYIPEVSGSYLGQKTISANVKFIEAVDSVKLFVNGIYANKLTTVIAGTNNITTNITEPGTYTLSAIGYKNSVSYQSSAVRVNVTFNPTLVEVTKPETNVIRATAALNEAYDSLQVYANDVLVKSVTSALTIGNNQVDFKIASSGTYTVYVKGFIGSDGYSSGTKNVSIVYVGIKNPTTKSLDIYPNPSNGLFNIDLPIEKIENSTLEVYSLSGSKVFSKTITESTNQIDLQQLNSGTYLIKLTKDGVIYSEKIQIRK